LRRRDGLFDEDGNSYDSVLLTSYGEAIRTVRRWCKRYPLNVADAYRMVYDHFTAKRDGAAISN
jgi:hypothetical protein